MLTSSVLVHDLGYDLVLERHRASEPTWWQARQMCQTVLRSIEHRVLSEPRIRDWPRVLMVMWDFRKLAHPLRVKVLASVSKDLLQACHCPKQRRFSSQSVVDEDVTFPEAVGAWRLHLLLDLCRTLPQCSLDLKRHVLLQREPRVLLLLGPGPDSSDYSLPYVPLDENVFCTKRM
jgi:hypothetical protein